MMVQHASCLSPLPVDDASYTIDWNGGTSSTIGLTYDDLRRRTGRGDCRIGRRRHVRRFDRGGRVELHFTVKCSIACLTGSRSKVD